MLPWVSGSEPRWRAEGGAHKRAVHVDLWHCRWAANIPRKVGQCRAGQGPFPSPCRVAGDAEGCCPLTPRQPGSQARALAWEPETLGPGSNFAMWP